MNERRKTMRKLTIKAYRITELPEDVQEEAYHQWLQETSYFNGTENIETLKRFAEIFKISVKDWEYGGYRPYIKYTVDLDADILELSGLRLYKYIFHYYYYSLWPAKQIGVIKKRISHRRLSWIQDKITGEKYSVYHSCLLRMDACPLTGYWMDEEILRPIREFLKKPEEHIAFEYLLKDCLESWVWACQKDYEECTSFEYFLQESEENGLLYDKYGRLKGDKNE